MGERIGRVPIAPPPAEDVRHASGRTGSGRPFARRGREPGSQAEPVADQTITRPAEGAKGSAKHSPIRCPAGRTDPEHHHIVKVFYREDGRLALGSRSFTRPWWDWLLALRDAVVDDIRQIDLGVLQPPPDQPAHELVPVHFPVPLHLAIAMELRPRIDDMELGEQLPPASTLAFEFGVSRTTAVRAIEDLTARGLVTTRPRQGSFVLSHIGYFRENFDSLDISELEDGRLTFGGTYSGPYRDWLVALVDAIDRKLEEIDRLLA